MTIRRLNMLVFGVAASLCCAGVQSLAGDQAVGSVAQQKTGPAIRRSRLDDDTIRVRLLTVEKVQKDVALTAAQLAAFQTLVRTSEEQSHKLLAKLGEALPAGQSLPQEEFEARMRQFQTWREKLKTNENEFHKKALAILTSTQFERLKQIHLQVAMPDAVVRPEVVKALDVSEEQRGRIRDMLAQMDQNLSTERPDLRHSNSKERQEQLIAFAKKSDRIRSAATKSILTVLTPQQRTQLEQLQGSKIEGLREALMPETGRLGWRP